MMKALILGINDNCRLREACVKSKSKKANFGKTTEGALDEKMVAQTETPRAGI